MKKYLVFSIFLFTLMAVSIQTKADVREWVDLGLPSGTKWATCNLGANSPEEFGEYYAWGETSPKEYYDNTNYLLTYKSYGYYMMSEYCTSENDGKVDNKCFLYPEHDAAHVNWGDDWRMPTGDEMQELMDCCKFEPATLNGVSGYNVKGPNGKTMFLPGASFKEKYSHPTTDDGALCYWTSKLSTDTYRTNTNYYAFSLNSSAGYTWQFAPSVSYRYCGMPIRPVCARFNTPSVSTMPANVPPRASGNGILLCGDYVPGETVVTEAGFYYSQSEDNRDDLVLRGTRVVATTSNAKAKKSDGYNTFTYELNGVELDRRYYYVAYFVSNGMEFRSSVQDFKVSTGGIEGFVDLDLPSGVLWAECNLGASKPEEFGNYYQWAATQPVGEDGATYANAPYCTKPDGNRSLWSKYIPTSTKEAWDAEATGTDTPDGKKELEPMDDAAYLETNGVGHAPQITDGDIDDFNELIANTYYCWTNNYNNTEVKGTIFYKLKDKSDAGQFNKPRSGKEYTLDDTHIFLPAAGYKTDKKTESVGTRGYYWTNRNNSYEAYPYFSHAYEFSILYGGGMYNGERSKGFSIRPVTNRKAWLRGDANADGTIDVADITTIAAIILGLDGVKCNAKNADANADGTIDVADITCVANIILSVDDK